MNKPALCVASKRLGALLLLAIAVLASSCRSTPAIPRAAQTTFTNPLLASGPDPWITYQNGWYYYMHTLGSHLSIWKTKQPADLRLAQSKKVWTPPAGKAYSENIWAPELHFIQGKW